jgi:endonuclease/exonuclease/phosphatase (EEP) superfamily protein YafD
VTVPDLRIVTTTLDARGEDALLERVRPLSPDVVIVHDGPRRLRWRTRSADLAARLQLYYGAGGEESLGNLMLVSMRITMLGSRAVRFPLTAGRKLRGAVVAQASVAGVPFTVVGTQLSPDDDERPAQLAIVHSEVSAVEGPVILAADVNETLGGGAWARLAQNRVAVGPEPAEIFLSSGIDVRSYRAVDGGIRPSAVADLALPPAAVAPS